MILQGFSTPVGTINILQRVGPDYKPLLGNILLKSHDGQRIKSLEMTNSNNVDELCTTCSRPGVQRMRTVLGEH